MTKIYLAKSNKSNPDDVMRVRQVLSSNYDVEIVEFKGGNYSHKPLLDCEILLVLPDLSGVEQYDNTGEVYEITVPFGKGLHEQIQAFASENYSNNQTYVIYEVREQYISIGRIEDTEPADSDDWISYSVGILDCDSVGDLKPMFDELLGYTDKSVTCKKNMYLLIE
jgi:hypothetical protein